MYLDDEKKIVLVLPQRITTPAEVSNDVVAKEEYFKREGECRVQHRDDDDQKPCRLYIRLQRTSQSIRDQARSNTRLTLERMGYTFAAI